MTNKYYIDYNTGAGNIAASGLLDDAKATADDNAAYTQADIVIYDDADREVARRRWWGVAYDPDVTEETEDEVIQIGGGYYGAWE